MRIFSILAMVVFLSSCLEGSLDTPLYVFIELESPTESSLRGISVVDDTIAWLSGANGTIVRTTDGGEHWQLINVPNNDSLDFRDIEAFDDRKAIVMSAGFPARFYKTEDAGESWKLVYENQDSAVFFNSIAFRDDQHGIAFSDQIKRKSFILTTSNGGESWDTLNRKLLPKALKMENGFAASGSCIALIPNGGTCIALGGKKSRILRTEKWDEKWKAVSTPMYQGAASRGSYSIAFKDSLRGIAVGGDYSEPDSAHQEIAIRTTDGGLNWELCEIPPSGYRSAVDYSEENNVWFACGTNGIDKSEDDGKTWFRFEECERCNTLQFSPSGRVAFIGAADGRILQLLSL